MNIKVIKPLNDYKKEFIKKDIPLLIGIFDELLDKNVEISDNFFDTAYFAFHKTSEVFRFFDMNEEACELNSVIMDNLDQFQDHWNEFLDFDNRQTSRYIEKVRNWLKQLLDKI